MRENKDEFILGARSLKLPFEMNLSKVSVARFTKRPFFSTGVCGGVGFTGVPAGSTVERIDILTD